MSKAEARKIDASDEDEYTVLSLSITRDNKKWLRLKAAEEETSMAAIVDKLITDARETE